MDNPSEKQVGLIDNDKPFDESSVEKVDLAYKSYDKKLYKFNAETLEKLGHLGDKLIVFLNYFKEYCACENKTRFPNVKELLRIDTALLPLQKPYRDQGGLLIPTPPVDKCNMTLEEEQKFKNCTTSSPTHHDLFYCSCWIGKLKKICKEALSNAFMCSSSGLSDKDYVESERDQVGRAIASSGRYHIYSKNPDKQMKHGAKKIYDRRILEKLSYKGSDAERNRSIDNAATDVFDKNLIPYLGRVVDYLIRQALNTSVAIGYINLTDAKEKYKEATQHTAFLCKKEYKHKYYTYINNTSRDASKNYQKRHIFYNPVNIIDKLEELSLQPIDGSYNQLVNLVKSIFFRAQDEPNKEILDSLKKEILDSLEMLYNIVYSTDIVDIMRNIAIIPLMYNAPKSTKVEHVQTTDARTKIIVNRYMILLTGVILNQGPDDKLTRMDTLVKELQSIGLCINSIESGSTPASCNATGEGSDSLVLGTNTKSGNRKKKSWGARR
ncbi:hypothetical protein [Cardinium endosymbiont of Nabis limbatus]|uniref:hypothetical protein n=1 Tax=Cardinium endosymbiont of Nabis limbatus TaxID=3066217 RepID=UPI003AF3D5A3